VLPYLASSCRLDSDLVWFSVIVPFHHRVCNITTVSWPIYTFPWKLSRPRRIQIRICRRCCPWLNKPCTQYNKCIGHFISINSRRGLGSRYLFRRLFCKKRHKIHQNMLYLLLIQKIKWIYLRKAHSNELLISVELIAIIVFPFLYMYVKEYMYDLFISYLLNLLISSSILSSKSMK